jgi:Iap family predicted aminopeptidase
VKVKINVAVEWHNEPAQGNGFNTIAEILGSDLVDEVVIAGAHLDSTQGSAGATDNAAGSATVMEIARIITRLGLKPRRTIRLALWRGEEEGLLGSQAYVKQHYGDWMNGLFTPGTHEVSAYFNVDNGSDRTRGIWMHGGLSAEPVLREWLTALRDLGVTTLGRRNTITSLSGGRLGQARIGHLSLGLAFRVLD